MIYHTLFRSRQGQHIISNWNHCNHGRNILKSFLIVDVSVLQAFQSVRRTTQLQNCGRKNERDAKLSNFRVKRRPTKNVCSVSAYSVPFSLTSGLDTCALWRQGEHSNSVAQGGITDDSWTNRDDSRRWEDSGAPSIMDVQESRIKHAVAWAKSPQIRKSAR